MASTVGNTAKQLPDSDTVEEPSMEEILASIKQIIADDEPSDDNTSERERYTYPDSHSNSNLSTTSGQPSEENINEMELQAALQAELGDIDLPQQEVLAPTASAPVSPVAKEKISMQEKTAKMHAELTATGAGLTADERLNKYRSQGKLQMEILAAEKAAIQAKVVMKPAPIIAPVSTTHTTGPATGFASGPLFPTTNAIAQEMASTMMHEKSDEIQNLLSEIMRPTIRQWLSDNLPTLVEKLVREEIEAVSRGRKTVS